MVPSSAAIVTITVNERSSSLSFHDLPTSFVDNAFYKNPSARAQEQSSYSISSTAAGHAATRLAFAPGGSTYGTAYLNSNDLEDPSQWYNQPFFVLTAWCFIIYSIMSFFAVAIMLSRGYLDWKLNFHPEAPRQATQRRHLSLSNEEPRFRTPREYEPRASESDAEEERNEEVFEQPWWEAFETHPHRRDPVAPNAPRLGSHRYIYETDFVSPHSPLSHSLEGSHRT